MSEQSSSIDVNFFVVKIIYFPQSYSHVLIIIIIQFLIKLLKFHNMSKDVLKNMLCIMGVVGKFRRDT